MRATDFKPGDVVRLLSVPDSLLSDLPESEQMAIRAQVGGLVTVSEIDKWGNVWVGFGETTEDGEGATFAGQSFVIDPDRIELVTRATAAGGA